MNELNDTDKAKFLSNLLKGNYFFRENATINKHIEINVQSEFSNIDLELINLLNVYCDRNNISYLIRCRIIGECLFIVFSFNKKPR